MFCSFKSMLLYFNHCLNRPSHFSLQQSVVSILYFVWQCMDISYGSPFDKSPELDNYRPISGLSVIAKVFGYLVNNQVKLFLMENNILNEFQSGFRSGHSTVTTAMLTTNDIITCLVNKQYCAALFVDLSKAFDSVDHKILLQRLSCLGFSQMSLNWFNNYLTERMHCVSVENFTSREIQINKGVPQGSILAPVLFSLYINDIDQEVKTAEIHLYADDTIMYTVAKSMNQAIELLQDSFRSLQFSLIKRKLVLN